MSDIPSYSLEHIGDLSRRPVKSDCSTSEGPTLPRLCGLNWAVRDVLPMESYL